MKLYGEKSSKFGHFLAILLEVRKHPKNRVLGGGGLDSAETQKPQLNACRFRGRLPI